MISRFEGLKPGQQKCRDKARAYGFLTQEFAGIITWRRQRLVEECHFHSRIVAASADFRPLHGDDAGRGDWNWRGGILF